MKAVSVRVPAKLTLDQSHKVLTSVLGKLGHPACLSGFKITFDDIVDPPAIFNIDRETLHISEVKG